MENVLRGEICAGIRQLNNPALHKTGERSVCPRIPTVIYGSVAPELIPDSVAYRMVFLSLAEPSNASQERRDHQHIKLDRLHLDQADELSLIQILASFQDQYTEMLNTFNNAVSNGPPPVISSLHEQRDDIVQNTRNLLAAQLSATGMMKLDNLVQSEKHNMKVAGGVQ